MIEIIPVYKRNLKKDMYSCLLVLFTLIIVNIVALSFLHRAYEMGKKDDYNSKQFLLLYHLQIRVYIYIYIQKKKKYKTSATLRCPLPCLPSPMICYEFFISCFYELFNFYYWVLFFVGDPFSRVFVLILIVSIPLHPPQWDCCYHFQLSARLSTSANELFLTGWKALSRVMSLLFTVLVFYPLRVNQSLALSKVDGAGNFLIPLELKKHQFPVWLWIWHCFISFGFIVGVPTPLNYSL